MNETRDLAGWVSGLAEAPLPMEVERVLAYALLDTVACGLFGRGLEWSRILVEWARAGGVPRDRAASVWGESEPSLRPSDAALVNGNSAHAFELDDYHPAKIHPGAVVVPAALALAEAHDRCGDTVMRALAAGYEVMIRTSEALGPSAARLRGWHLTGVAGTLGAAAASAVVLGLDPIRTAWALGLAGTQSSGLFAFTADGAMSKRFHAGNAARAGVAAAELAAAGYSGPTRIYEAPDGGLLGAFVGEPDPDRLLAGLGERWRTLDTAFKPYACCASLHSYVDAAIELREALGPERAASGDVRIGLARVVELQCGFDYEPGSALSAQMNARYCVAVALRFGSVLPREFAADRLADPETLALMERIEQRHDPDLDRIYPERFCGWVELRAGPGASPRRVYRDEPSGAGSNPHKGEAMAAKFHRLLAGTEAPAREALAEALLAPRRHPARRLIELVASAG